MYTHPGKKLNFMGNEMAHFREWDEKNDRWTGTCSSTRSTTASRNSSPHVCRLYATEPALYDGEYNPGLL